MLKAFFLLSVLILSAWYSIEIEDDILPWKGNTSSDVKVVVIGAALLDFLAEPKNELLLLQTSNPGTIHRSWGGVSRNIAASISRALPYMIETARRESVFFISAVGNDAVGTSFYSEHPHFDTRGVSQHNENSGVYLAIAEGSAENNDLHTAIVQVDILKKLTPLHISKHQETINQASLVVIDGNLPLESILYIATLCNDHPSLSLFFEPTSVPKSCRLFEAGVPLSAVTYISPNIFELGSMASWIEEHDDYKIHNEYESPIIDAGSYLEVEKKQVVALLRSGIQHIITTLGPEGTLLGFVEDKMIVLKHFPAPNAKVIQVNGAGDAMAGCCIASLVKGNTIEQSIEIGHLCAKIQLENESFELLPKLLAENYRQ